MKKIFLLFGISIENFKTLKYHTFLEKLLSISFSKCANEDKKNKEEESIEILTLKIWLKKT